MPDRLPTLTGARIALRPTTTADAEVLARMIAEPEVARWWGAQGADVGVQRSELLEYAANGGSFTVEADEQVIGWVGVEEQSDPDYRHASIDIFLRPASHGSGFGAEAIRLVAHWLFEVRGHHRLTIDPAVANERAIAVYESVGFRPVGVLRSYERGPDGTFHDGLLMDMLSGELR